MRLCIYTATRGVFLVPISWYQRVELKQTTEPYRRYIQFNIAFVFWLKVSLDVLQLRNFLSVNLVPLKMKIICFWFKTMKNDWVWRKVFHRFITILSVSVDILRAFFFSTSINIRGALRQVLKLLHQRTKDTLTTLQYGICTYLFLITLCKMPRGL